jgi:hypothetical protein
MSEPPELLEARRRLAKAEASLNSGEALAELEEGLALLDELIGSASDTAARTARNLAATYAERIYRYAGEIAADPGAAEPALEQLFKMVLAFDRVSVELPAAARRRKIEVVRRLVERYYEGHPPELKRRVLEELAQLADGD